MKTYTIKPEYLTAWGTTSDENTVDDAEISRLSAEWGVDEWELLRQVEINPAYMAAAVELMDDDIREDMHNNGDCDNDAQFLMEYEKRHLDKYGQAFTI
jgi:hypothetical protein